jgi:hypothetical protein
LLLLDGRMLANVESSACASASPSPRFDALDAEPDARVAAPVASVAAARGVPQLAALASIRAAYARHSAAYGHGPDERRARAH